ncbi:M20 family metallopeptidase [Marinilactibacillus psychrotolerans]|uniref:Peptidase M20 domain-containing protein 2 n=1 Tax=Marinilactibacillus psychrotolerans TaxID=191770 RepID=A0AAV3WRV4_9LACT|nr:M20 family metallopeptidase [Marinilactibacillus psychrotolerans]GEL66996.1 amidohydrolase [Marinilactibacillus psychrotolerans]GEQ36141.1 amidohydrolase [Marinilactibacillus psychrotolerans]SDC75099.1 amidohydrolase [Marinilactibacillus psychrotolerans]
MVEKYTEKIQNIIKDLRPELQELSEYIYEHPELGHEEFLSSKAHVELLKNHGFEVEYPYLGVETAFRAIYKGEKEGLAIAYLSEYDALPGIGHGCGHNLLGSTDTGAGIALSKLVDEIGGTVVVLGTPAEETNGDKVTMAAADTFDDIDVAFCTHPSDGYYTSGTSMAMEAIEFRFYGKTAHAAAAPFEGLNALDACLNMFNNINSFRQQMHPSARVHGVIKDGGEAANIIPEYTRAEFYVRAMDMPYLNELREKVIKCAEAGAMAAGCTMEWDYYEASYQNLVTNESLSKRYNQNMKLLGVKMQEEERDSMGSMDMGNVSQVVPAINPYFEITNGKTVSAHTIEFRECTRTEEAYKGMENTIAAFTQTAIDLITDSTLLESVKEEFNNSI